MSITAETAKQHANDPAVSCCRFEVGTIIDASNLEDPAIFEDLKESGLLEITADTLTIGQVLGAKLTATVDALTPLTKNVVDSIKQNNPQQNVVEKQTQANVEPVEKFNLDSGNQQSIKIHIGSGTDIDIELPIPTLSGSQENCHSQKNDIYEQADVKNQSVIVNSTADKTNNNQILRKLIKKHYKISEVKIANKTEIVNETLYIRDNLINDALQSEELVLDVKLDIITKADYDKYSETIMDVQPVAVKEEGEIGHGITRVLDNVIVVVTGVDEKGVQIGEFGSSEGILNRNIMWNRPGAPDFGDIFIKTEITIKEKTNMERPGPLAAHKATDVITSEIRKALLACDRQDFTSKEFIQVRRKGKKKVLIVKEIMGQGAMHDNLILPFEPCGTIGAVANVDLGNVPVMLSPTEVLDGGIHALTCIGPASKETTRHYWREPLILEAMLDEDIDLCGVVLIGSPQINSEKFYVSKRLGMLVESMDLDGVIITTEGFGNNHIDFASHHEEVGKRGIAVVGCTFSANQGALVVGNKYMSSMVDLNKSKQGIENEILSNNTLCEEDAIRALTMLKARMFGNEIKPAERKWSNDVKLNNINLINKELNKNIELKKNEQSLEKSKKRKEIYEVE